MSRSQAHQGVRMIKFVSILSRYEAAKLTPEERARLVERVNLTLLDRQAKIASAWDEEVRRRKDAYRLHYERERIVLDAAARDHRERKRAHRLLYGAECSYSRSCGQSTAKSTSESAEKRPLASDPTIHA